MRTNYSGFALAVCMGLVVLLLGFLALSAGGLVQLGPPEEVAAVEEQQCQGDGSMLVVNKDARPLPPINSPDGRALADGQAIAAGDALFKANCTQCHAVNEKVVGPALAGITKRRRLTWVTSWVHNSAKVIASGDEYAVKLFNDYGKQQMPSFPELSDTDIKNILAWINWQEDGATVNSTSTVAAN